MQQMIPHHQNAVNMAKILLKSVSSQKITEAIDEDGLTHMLHTIIAAQNYQIHQFRGYLGAGPADAAPRPPHAAATSATKDDTADPADPAATSATKDDTADPVQTASKSIMAAFQIMVAMLVAFML